jgi:monovalent cation:H+ antiporter-2, CPA2 family
VLSALEVTLVLLAAVVPVVVVLRQAGLPPLVAYLSVGVVLGPHAVGLAADQQAVHDLGEIGVVFLMFSLGLEFNPAKLAAMRRFVFGLGAAQVAATIVAAVAVLAVVPAQWLQWALGAPFDWRAAIALGGAVAMSSTALVSKLLAERRELESEHGRRVFAVLLFQDLAVIPLLTLVPALAGGVAVGVSDMTGASPGRAATPVAQATPWGSLLGVFQAALGGGAGSGAGPAPSGEDAVLRVIVFALVKAMVILVVLLRFGPPVMRRWFNVVARQRSHELFTLNVLLATLLFAWLARTAGLSMELGAFLAGMLIAETEFRWQVEEDIKPFRDVLLGLFFVAIGMQLDLSQVAANWPRVLVLLVVPLTVKAFLVALLARVFGAANGTAIRVGVWLAQAGEFGFVLLNLAGAAQLIPSPVLQPILAAMLLSLLISPWLVQQAGRLALAWSAQEFLQRSLQIQAIASRSLARERHVLVCGYGRCGQQLAHVLETEQIAFMALDLDADRVRVAAQAGESVVYGDCTRRDALVAAGIHRAQALVVTFDDTAVALRVLAMVRELAAGLPVLVRTAHEADIERLRAAGATEVVPEIIEGSLMLASHALALAGVPLAQVQRRVTAIRDSRYALLQGFFHGRDDDTRRDTIEDAPMHLRAVALPELSRLGGQALSALQLGPVRVTTLVHHGKRMVDPPDETLVTPGDVLVISGTLEQISAAEAKIRS